MMLASDEKMHEASKEQPAKASVSGIGDDVQRSKDRISEAATAAREDITAELHRLRADVVSLKDTLAELAKTVTAQVGEASANVGEDITSSVKDHANALLSEFETIARRNPLGVVLGALGIGMLIGLMKGRR